MQETKRCRFSPWIGKIPWRRKWLPTPVFLPGESPGQRSLAGDSPRGCKESGRLSDWTKEQPGSVWGLLLRGAPETLFWRDGAEEGVTAPLLLFSLFFRNWTVIYILFCHPFKKVYFLFSFCLGFKSFSNFIFFKCPDFFPFLKNWRIVDDQCCVSSIQQCNSVINTLICILFHVLFQYGLSQDVEYSSHTIQ